MTMSLAVKSSFEFSPALSAHIEHRINHALRAHAAHIKWVVLRLSDVNGPRHGADDKLTRIDISLNSSGTGDPLIVPVLGSLRQRGDGHNEFGGIHGFGQVHLESALKRLHSIFGPRIRRQHGGRYLTHRDIARLSD
jgi:hypothetical protein